MTINRGHHNPGSMFLSLPFHCYLYGIEIEIDDQPPDENERKAMQVIQDRHDGLNYIFLVENFIVTHTQIEFEIDEHSPDEDDRMAMQVIQDRHDGLNTFFFVKFFIVLIPK